MNVALSGLISGFDSQTLVNQLVEVERTPERRLQAEQSDIQLQINAFGSLKTQLGVLSNRVDDLVTGDLFDSRNVLVSDETVATATGSTGTPLGSFNFNISQLATTSAQKATADAGTKLNATNTVSSLVLSSAGFSTAVTAGTITVNGKIVNIATSDTLQTVFDNISTATGTAVTGSYDSVTDKITLSSASEIVLGSTTDTSNFLQVSQLRNNGTGTVTSANALGGIVLSQTLVNGNFATAVSDGGSGSGSFKVNGVSISFSATTDTVNDVLARINDSAAGVTASYDVINDQFILTNDSTGDLGVALQDVTGNFLAATGLSSGALTRGKDLLYTVNGGGTLVSPSNTITDGTSGITGLTVDALKPGSTIVTVTSDTAKIKTAIEDFVSAYNTVQSLIDTQTASSTDSNGKVTAGVLSGDPTATDISDQLRSIAFATVTGLPDAMNHLADLGIDSSGNDNSLTIKNSATLDTALQDQLGAVKKLFVDPTLGVMVSLNSFLDSTIGANGATGTLDDKTSNLNGKITDIDDQIARIERQVLADRDRLLRGFAAMEQAQAKINQQSQFLANLGGG